MTEQTNNALEFEIDKLTNSIENAFSGESFPTEVLPLKKAELKNITKKNGWLFDWKAEIKLPEREVYKLITKANPDIIHGLVSIEIEADHIAMLVIESAPFNLGKDKIYLGVAGNLVAFVCKRSFECGFEGDVFFFAKTKLIDHYSNSLGAIHVGGHRMIIRTRAAKKLVNQYFPNFDYLSETK